MISDLKNQCKFTLKEITQKVTDECCTNYHCKDNVTLIIVDLKKHYNDHCAKIKKSNKRQCHSQVRHFA